MALRETRARGVQGADESVRGEGARAGGGGRAASTGAGNDGAASPGRVRRAEERHARELEAVREEMRPTRWEFEKLQEERLEDQRKHAEDRRAALDEAAREYDTALEKLRFSHAYEGRALRQAHEERLDVYRREQAKSETKLTMAVEHLNVDLREALRELEKERDAADGGGGELAKGPAPSRGGGTRIRGALERTRRGVGPRQRVARARDTAERRTKETYLEIERARHAGDKRRWIHAEEKSHGTTEHGGSRNRRASRRARARLRRRTSRASRRRARRCTISQHPIAPRRWTSSGTAPRVEWTPRKSRQCRRRCTRERWR